MKRLACLMTMVIGAGACGGSSVSSPPPTFAPGTLEVHAISGLRLDSKEYAAKAGDVAIGYANRDNIRHSLIIAKDSTKIPNFKLVVNNKNDVDSETVALTAGTYTLLCDVPGHSEMKATLIIS